MLPLLLLFALPSLRGASAASGFIPMFAGPYIVYIDYARPCGDPAEGEHWFPLRFSHFRPARPLERQVWNGVTNMTDSVDDSWWSRVILDINSGNAWKENAFVFNFPRNGCSDFRKLTSEDVRRMFFPAMDKPCLVKKGVRRLVNESVSLEFSHFRVMIYGYYRSRVYIGRHGESQAVACSSFTLHVIPRA